MTTFEISWALSFTCLVILTGCIGKWTKTSYLGILIDNRGRFSLTHLQIVLWTLIILSSIVGVLIATNFDPSKISLSTQLLGLMGISAGSAVLSTGVKGAKDAPGGSANVAKAGAFQLSSGSTTTITAKFSQIWLEEEGDQADNVVSVTKFQNFIFTLVIVGTYVSIALKTGGLPVLPDNMVWLIGISQAGYVGGKIPDKS
ncbi:hypothetical protein GALL_203670 [mine drainage metagenome]|uniref:Uncharacterized protein n=1 Tax=mine drainage metagenome TaxID=410659 RepID=A0A1J5RMY8_9ZZZZ